MPSDLPSGRRMFDLFSSVLQALGLALCLLVMRISWRLSRRRPPAGVDYCGVIGLNAGVDFLFTLGFTLTFFVSWACILDQSEQS